MFLQELLRPLGCSSLPHLSDHISAHANVRMAFGRPLQLPTVYSHHTSSKFALLTWLAGNFICFGKLFTLMLRALIISCSYYYLHRHWGKVGYWWRCPGWAEIYRSWADDIRCYPLKAPIINKADIEKFVKPAVLMSKWSASSLRVVPRLSYPHHVVRSIWMLNSHFALFICLLVHPDVNPYYFATGGLYHPTTRLNEIHSRFVL